MTKFDDLTEIQKHITLSIVKETINLIIDEEIKKIMNENLPKFNPPPYPSTTNKHHVNKKDFLLTIIKEGLEFAIAFADNGDLYFVEDLVFMRVSKTKLVQVVG